MVGMLGGNVIGTAVLEIVTDSTKADAGLTAFQRRVAIGTVAAFGIGVHAATQFETELAKISNFTNATEADVASMRKEILALGPAVGRGPQELAEALYTITSAGQYGANALAILEASAKGSVAGLGQTADIAKIVTSAVNAYGEANLSAAKATDVLIAAVREGSAEPAEMANQLGRVIGVAAQMDVQFADVASAVAILTKNGIDTDQAVTGLRTTLLALNNPASQAGKALAEVGLDADAIRRTIREKGLIQGLQQLSEAFGGNTEKIAEVIPEARAIVSVFGLVGKAADEAAEAQARVRAAIGLTDETFDRASKTTGVQFARAVASVMTILVLLGQDVLPPVAASLEKIADVLAAGSEQFQKLPPPMRQAIVLLALLGGLLPVINSALVQGRLAWAGNMAGVVAHTASLQANALAARQAAAAAVATAAANRGAGGLNAGSDALLVLSTRQAAAQAASAASAARLTAALASLRPVAVIAGTVLGGLASSSDNLTASFVGTQVQGFAMGAMFGPLGAIAGGLVGTLLALAGASDAVAAAQERMRQAMLANAQNIAQSMSPADIRAELRAANATVERIRGEIQKRGSGGFAGQANSATEALRGELFDATQRAITFANALNIVQKGEALTAEQTKQVTEAMRGAQGAIGGVTGALDRLSPEMVEADIAAAILSAGILDVAEAAELMRLGAQGLADPFLVALHSIADAADDAALAIAGAREAASRAPGQYSAALQKAIDEARLRRALREAADPGGSQRKLLGELNGGGSQQLTPEQQLAKALAEDVARAIADAINTGADVEAAVAKVRSQQQRLAELFPQFAEFMARNGEAVTDELRHMFLTMKEIAKQETESLGGLLGFLIQRRVGMGRPGALYDAGGGMGPQSVFGGGQQGFLTQHNQIVLEVADPAHIDVAGMGDGLRAAGFGARGGK